MRTFLFLAFSMFLAAGEPMRPEQLLEFARVGGLALSPDGTQTAVVVSRPDLAANSSTSELWLFTGDMGQGAMLTSGFKDHTPVFAMDGQTLYFCSNRAGGQQIFSLSLANRDEAEAKGEPVQLSRFDFSFANLKLKADGSGFLFTRDVLLDQTTAQRHPDLVRASGRVFDGLMYRHWDSWSDGSYSHLFSCDLQGGKVTDHMEGLKVHSPLRPFGGAEQFTSSADGRVLVYTAKQVDRPAESTDSDLYWLDLPSGQRRNLSEGMDGYDTNPAFSPDGSQMAFLSMTTPGYEADRNRLMLLDLASGKVREASAGLDLTIADYAWEEGGKSVLFTAPEKGNVALFRMDLASGRVSPLGSFNGNVQAFALRGRRVRALLSTHLRPNELYRLDEGGNWQRRSQFNDDLLERLALPSYESVWVDASDGGKIHNWVFYPPGFDAKRTYPLLVFCQGGPQSMISQSFSYRWNFHLMAAQGYVVCAVNRRGLPGFGQVWNDAITRDWAGQAMRDILASTDAMQARPYLDPARSAAVGASFGGYTVYWLMGHNQEPRRFASMIAHAGVFNLESMAGATEELFFVHHDLGGPYWASEELRESYRRQSPHQFVQRWDTPLLVIHGELDYRVPVTEGMQAFTAAQLRGLKSRFLYYPDEGHWILKPQNGMLWQREFFGWLAETLPSQP